MGSDHWIGNKQTSDTKISVRSIGSSWACENNNDSDALANAPDFGFAMKSSHFL